jgi:hypothetical protein
MLSARQLPALSTAASERSLSLPRPSEAGDCTGDAGITRPGSNDDRFAAKVFAARSAVDGAYGEV